MQLLRSASSMFPSTPAHLFLLACELALIMTSDTALGLRCLPRAPNAGLVAHTVPYCPFLLSHPSSASRPFGPICPSGYGRTLLPLARQVAFHCGRSQGLPLTGSSMELLSRAVPLLPPACYLPGMALSHCLGRPFAERRLPPHHNGPPVDPRRPVAGKRSIASTKMPLPPEC
eukprot:GGOE01011098.1.p1 GENE.GGOE01011098.1~~GGOE01011098.1.p1  ORF type:complete len:173 (-),score=3.89 GGOE01011098.1:721-1239(-)